MSLETILGRAITKIAHKACRNGEAGTRAWPPLAQLPEPESWKCVGEKYAPEIAAEILNEILAEHVRGGVMTRLLALLRRRG